MNSRRLTVSGSSFSVMSAGVSATLGIVQEIRPGHTMGGMTSTETQPAKPAAEEAPSGWDAMDTLGLIAGAVLVVIVIDIVSDGRLISRRLRGPKPQAEQVSEPVPND